MNFKEIANQLLRLFLIVFTSFWNATIHIVWGITTIFLLVGLLNYFNADASAIQSLLKITDILKTKWSYFFMTFLVYEIYIKAKELSK